MASDLGGQHHQSLAQQPLGLEVRQQARKRFVVVLLPVVVAEAKCSAELGAQDHQRLIQRLTLAESGYSMREELAGQGCLGSEPN